MKKAVLLDIDGTLLDSHDFVFSAVRHTLTTHGYSYPTKTQLKKVQGKALMDFYQMLLPEVDIAKLAQTHVEFQKNNFHLVKPFPKIIKTLISLKEQGFTLAAVSNRMRESLLKSLKHVGILDYFDIVVGADDVNNPKPHKDHVLAALQKLGVEPENAYMVGDTDHDILAGKSAGVKTIGVTYGWLGQDIKKYKPDYVIDDIEQLLKILK